MMRKLLILVALIATVNSYAQYTLDFEDTSKYGFWHQGSDATVTEHDAITNPVQAGINTSATCIRFTETAGAQQWEFPFINNTVDANTDPEGDGNSFGFTLNGANGKILKLKVMSANETTFELLLEPWIGGVKYESPGAPTITLTGVTLNTWYEAEFDLSSAPEGWLSRIDIRFNPTGGNRDGDVFYIDDLQQALTLSNDKVSKQNSLKAYPNPVINLIKFPEYQNFKSVSIYNLIGQEVKQLTSERTIDVSDLTSGVYILKTDNGATSKFVKQ